MVVSGSFPPFLSGSAVLMDNLLRSYPGDVVAVAGFHEPTDVDFLPPCQTVRFEPPKIRVIRRAWERLRKKRLFHWLLGRFIRRKVAQYRPAVILATCPDFEFFVEAFRAARKAGIPFYAHMHDLWEENHAPGTFWGNLARKWEKTILTRSDRVLCMTQFQADFYKEKYGVACGLLPHTVSREALDRAPAAMVSPKLPKRTVLFVGNPARLMNMDALGVLARATELLPQDVEFLVLGSLSAEQLERAGVASSRLRARWAPRKDAQVIQSSAHVLVAPLSHKNGSPDEVRTVFSTKVLEYLVSGRPVLVTGPDYSFHVHSAKQGAWAMVVDQDDPKAIADALRRILEDEELAARLVQGALQEARRRDARVHARALHEWVLGDSRAL
jgi:glycosyltransferase involved in cell wall biosynthesis